MIFYGWGEDEEVLGSNEEGTTFVSSYSYAHIWFLFRAKFNRKYYKISNVREVENAEGLVDTHFDKTRTTKGEVAKQLGRSPFTLIKILWNQSLLTGFGLLILFMVLSMVSSLVISLF